MLEAAAAVVAVVVAAAPVISAEEEAPSPRPAFFLATAFVAAAFVFEAAASADNDGCGDLNVVGDDEAESLRDLLLLFSLWFLLECRRQPRAHTHRKKISKWISPSD